jgi:hypothetical protein
MTQLSCKPKEIDLTIGVIFPITGFAEYLLPVKYGLVIDVQDRFKAKYNMQLHHNSATGYDVMYLVRGLIQGKSHIDKSVISLV